MDKLIVLQGKDITKSFGTDMIFKDISFVINEGEKVGLVGPNGAGKTTLFRCLTNEEQLDGGEITAGSKFTVGYLEQIPNYPLETTLLDCVLESFAHIFAMRDKLRKLEKQMGEKSGRELEKLLELYSILTHEYEGLSPTGTITEPRG